MTVFKGPFSPSLSSYDKIKDFYANHIEGGIEFEWTTSLITISWRPSRPSLRVGTVNPINGTISMIRETDDK